MNYIHLLQTSAVLSKALENAKFSVKSLTKPLDRPSLYFVALENDKVFIFPSMEHEESEVLKECMEFEFVKVHKPKNIIFTIHDFLPEEIDENVKLFMKEFGIDSIRGGSYLDVQLSQDVFQDLAKELDLA